MLRLPDTLKLHVEDMPGRTWDFVVPLDWIQNRETSNSILAFFHLPDGRIVGVNAFGHEGHVWIHASTSHPHRLPTYEELCALKEVVFGPHGVCAQVFEATENHVNIHPNCLHLWGPRMASVWPLPRFTGGTI